jgi:menaquinone-dependent protoporphyrinogen IX oxidase
MAQHHWSKINIIIHSFISKYATQLVSSAMQVLVQYLTASQLWKKEKKVTSYNNTALPIQQPPQVVSKIPQLKP